MQRARNEAIRRRHQLIVRKGEVIGNGHLHECSLSSKIISNRAIDENQKLKSQLNLAKHKMELKDKLMQDSLNCTFIACPCSDNANMPNVDTIFNMRKKVIELRDLVAL